MIKETDASKNDERQVKNKLNPLTHKKKGETHIMGNQGMKNWKLGAFFVISLMLMVGLFTTTAPAHDPDGDLTRTSSLGSVVVTTSPKDVTAEGLVTLTVKYTATLDLAVPDTDADVPDTDADESTDDSTFGRIQVQLPAGWGPATNDELTDLLSLRAFSRVKLRKAIATATNDVGTPTVVNTANTDGWQINIDVDDMRRNEWVTLTIRNLQVAKLDTLDETGNVGGVTAGTLTRGGRTEDIDADELAKAMAQIMVTADQGPLGVTDEGVGNYPPGTLEHALETQPALAVGRKKLGKVGVSVKEFRAGEKKDFAITYTFTDDMIYGGIIDITLPKGWDQDKVPAFEFLGTVPTADEVETVVETDKHGYVYLSALFSPRLKMSRISGIFDESGGDNLTPGDPATGQRIVRISVIPGANGGPIANHKIVLNYKNATARRSVTSAEDTAMIEVYSQHVEAVVTDGEPTGYFIVDTNTVVSDTSMITATDITSIATDTVIPQYPPTDDKRELTVKQAASGSGMVVVQFANPNAGYETLMPFTDTTPPNTGNSIPAGAAPKDGYSLSLSYMPEGEMSGGMFELRLPSGWTAETILWTSVEDDDVEESNGVYTVTLPDEFGLDPEDAVSVSLEEVTSPDRYGNHQFTSRSKYKGGSFKALKSDNQPKVPVGNAMGDNDVVSVSITPDAAYHGESDVDFEITIEANGPMYNSEILIRVPEGITGLQMGTAGDDNYVRKIQASVSNVFVTVPDDTILITTGSFEADGTVDKTGKLNKGGTIRVGLHNVDISDEVSTLEADGFRVETRTRVGGGGAFGPGEGNTIAKDDASRSITGGSIKTVAGSGEVMVKPLIVEKNSLSNNFTITYEASTDFEKKDLTIEPPPVIGTPLQMDKSSAAGYVSVPASF